MKKLSALFLVLIMICAMGSALAVDADFRKTVAEYEGIPEIPEFAKMTTIQQGKTITIYLSQPVDSLTAQWLGYQEEPEELTVGDDLTATLSTEGHRYQVGARWVNWSYRDYDWEKGSGIPAWDYGTGEPITKAQVEEIIAEATAALGKGEHVEVRLPEWTVERQSEEPETFTWIDEEGVEHEEIYYPWIVIATYPYDTPEEEIEVPEGAFLFRNSGWVYVYTIEYGASNGNPNEAYKVQEGNWTVIHKRNGAIKYFYVTVEGSDFFGIAPGTATIRFEKNNAGWCIRSIVEEYEEGSFESAAAYYDGMGNLLYGELKLREE